MQLESDDAAEASGADEDGDREAWLKQIALAALKAADRVSSIQQAPFAVLALTMSCPLKIPPDS